MDIEHSITKIHRCRYPSGLHSAVPPDSTVMVPIYTSVWIRDTVYTLLAFEALGDLDRLRDGVHALLDRILLRWSYRLDWRIVEGVPTPRSNTKTSPTGCAPTHCSRSPSTTAENPTTTPPTSHC